MSRVKVPANMNLVRVTGLGLGYPVPKGFQDERVRLEGDHQKYLLRFGYRLARCPSDHGFSKGCTVCEPYHGAVAILSDCPYCRDNPSPLCPYCARVRQQLAILYPELPRAAQAKSSGALATPGSAGIDSRRARGGK